VYRRRALSQGGRDEQSWGLQLRRYISVKQELDEWSYTPRSVTAEVSRYGKLDGLRGLEPRTAFDCGRSRSPRRSRDATADTTGHGIDVMPSAASI